jgi:hypothetical protein
LTGPAWSGFAGDAQHTADSAYASQALSKIHWQTTIDLHPQTSGGELIVHYASPIITRQNTVIVAVKTGLDGGFRLDARDGATGALKWSLPVDYQLPPHVFVPTYSMALAPSGRLYFAGAGGTVYYINDPDVSFRPAAHRMAFYGISNYTAHKSALNASVFIDTPLTISSAGNVFFGFQVTGSNPLNLSGGVARQSSDGSGRWVSASAASGDFTDDKVVQNCAPALSLSGGSVYVVVNRTNILGVGAAPISGSYLLRLNSQNLKTLDKVRLRDPMNNADANISDAATSSPTVGPNGDVFFGILDYPQNSNHDRGWLLHFNFDLSKQMTPGDFGWDDTASIVPAAMVKSYHGKSSYLLMTKYNNYADHGGNGVNKMAILDPTASQTDPSTHQTVMKQVLSIAGVTPDADFLAAFPHAVKEWCINTAVVDPATDSILANSEDGKLYRWNLSTNTFTQVVKLTSGLTEAYTPTVVGPDGTVYAINDSILFAVGR